MELRRIACVLKRSETYDTDYVEKLTDGLEAHLSDFELTVIEDSPWPRWWSKMSLFDPDLGGDFLYFDLDTVIVGPIDDLFTGQTTVLADFNLPRPNFMGTGVMFLPEQVRAPIWEDWIKCPDWHMAKHGGNGDGGYLSRFFKKTALRWQDILPGQIVSYKLHCKKGVPEGARVVCFHGNPRPRQVNWQV